MEKELSGIPLTEKLYDMEDVLIAFEIAYRKKMGIFFLDRLITGIRLDSEADAVNLAFRTLSNLRCMSLNDNHEEK